MRAAACSMAELLEARAARRPSRRVRPDAPPTRGQVRTLRAFAEARTLREAALALGVTPRAVEYALPACRARGWLEFAGYGGPMGSAARYRVSQAGREALGEGS